MQLKQDFIFRTTFEPHAKNRKRFHLFRLVIVLLIVLTLGFLSSVRASTRVTRAEHSTGSSVPRVEDFTGFYKPLRFISGDEIQLPDSLSLEEIKIAHEKLTNSLTLSVTKSTRGSEIGNSFLDAFTQINDGEQVETRMNLIGCRVITRSSRFDENRISVRVENVLMLGCRIPVSKTTTTQTLQKGEYEHELLLQITDKNGRPVSRYVFKRN